VAINGVQMDSAYHNVLNHGAVSEKRSGCGNFRPAGEPWRGWVGDCQFYARLVQNNGDRWLKGIQVFGVIPRWLNILSSGWLKIFFKRNSTPDANE